MKSLTVLPLLSLLELSSGFSPAMHQSLMVAASRSNGKIMGTSSRITTQLYSSQWDDEDVEAEAKETTATTTRSTFYEAGDSLREEDDKEKLDGMGDYDSNPAVRYVWDLKSAVVLPSNLFGISLPPPPLTSLDAPSVGVCDIVSQIEYSHFVVQVG
jgi:hypothetical protein